jgi:RimJ/RimL family protein N-acetyltransferase
VSIVSAPELRGRGVAPAALSLARELAPGADLVAEVLPANAASLALFERAGYGREADGLFHARPTPVTVH